MDGFLFIYKRRQFPDNYNGTEKFKEKRINANQELNSFIPVTGSDLFSIFYLILRHQGYVPQIYPVI